MRNEGAGDIDRYKAIHQGSLPSILSIDQKESPKTYAPSSQNSDSGGSRVLGTRWRNRPWTQVCRTVDSRSTSSRSRYSSRLDTDTSRSGLSYYSSTTPRKMHSRRRQEP